MAAGLASPPAATAVLRRPAGMAAGLDGAWGEACRGTFCCGPAAYAACEMLQADQTFCSLRRCPPPLLDEQLGTAGGARFLTAGQRGGTPLQRHPCPSLLLHRFSSRYAGTQRGREDTSRRLPVSPGWRHRWPPATLHHKRLPRRREGGKAILVAMQHPIHPARLEQRKKWHHRLAPCCLARG